MLATVFSAGVFAQVGSRYFEEAGGYSICPPQSWEARSFAPSTNKIIIGPMDNGYPVTMVFSNHDELKESFTDYIKGVLLSYMILLKNFDFKEAVDFTTNSGLNGIKLFFTYQFNNIDIQAYAYFFVFPNGHTFDVTCGNALVSFDKFEKRFDESVKTLEAK
jgi:hypothetical protein